MMMIIGYKGEVNTSAGIRAVQKHMNLDRQQAKKIIDDVISGQPTTLDSDWVLREDLEDAGFILK